MLELDLCNLLFPKHKHVLDATVLGIFHTLHTKGLGGLGTMSQCHLDGMMREEHLDDNNSFVLSWKIL
jgi:hypothetical protein